jgi:hypothetical protein
MEALQVHEMRANRCTLARFNLNYSFPRERGLTFGTACSSVPTIDVIPSTANSAMIRSRFSRSNSVPKRGSQLDRFPEPFRGFVHALKARLKSTCEPTGHSSQPSARSSVTLAVRDSPVAFTLGEGLVCPSLATLDHPGGSRREDEECVCPVPYLRAWGYFSGSQAPFSLLLATHCWIKYIPSAPS